MRYTVDEFEILMYQIVRRYELDWDAVSLFIDVEDCAYAELKLNEHLENYEHCALLVEFIKWVQDKA